MLIMAIDPGYEQSAYVLYNGRHVLEHAIEPNDALLARLTSGQWRVGEIAVVVIEMIESFGMPVGRETFETVFLIGRIYERATLRTRRAERVTRRTVKLHLCHSARAKDSNIRTALIDRFGGSKAAAIGTKSARGVLYGIRADEWQALALAVTYYEQRGSRPAVHSVPTVETSQ